MNSATASSVYNNDNNGSGAWKMFDGDAGSQFHSGNTNVG
jgi:hypothetical protein